MKESLTSLARDISRFPSNHDELEILIEDRIKRYIHQEKSFWYKMALKDLHDLSHLVSDETKNDIFKERIHILFGLKGESHRELSEIWEYGTNYSVKKHR